MFVDRRFLSGIPLFLLTLAHIAVAQPRNTTIDIDGNETSIAIDPRDTRQFVAGANLAWVFVSSDRGITWQASTLASPLGVWGDPSVVFDSAGNAYYAHLSNPPAGAWIDRIVAQRSSDHGATWSLGEGTYYDPGKQQDKEWLAVDLTGSRFNGTIHASWTEFDRYGSRNPQDRSRILYAHSTDQGSSWSSAVRVSDVEGDCVDSDSTTEGAVPTVGPDGEVYIAWSDARGIAFDRSTDGGATWGVDRIIADQPGGWDYNVPGLIRCNGLPVTACDVSRGPHRGDIYVSWTDQRNGLGDTDVWLVRSTDAGLTWSAPRRVNGDATSTHQFMSWMALDKVTGAVYIIYYDRRRYADSTTDVVLARSIDGGLTFTEQRVSEQSFVPNPQVFLGDYVGIDAHDRTVAMIWTRIDGAASSVVTAAITDSTFAGSGASGSRAGALACRAVFGSGRDLRTGVRFSLPRPQRARVDAFDQLGRFLGTVADRWFEAGDQTIWWRGGTHPTVVVFRVEAEDGTIGCVTAG